MRFASLFALCLCSCEVNHYDALSATGNRVHEDNYQLGGTRSATRSDGSGYANSYETSFRDGSNTLTTIAGGVITGGVTKAVQKSKDAVKIAAGANSTKVTLGAQQAATSTANAATAAKTATTIKAIEAGAPLAPVTVNPP